MLNDDVDTSLNPFRLGTMLWSSSFNGLFSVSSFLSALSAPPSLLFYYFNKWYRIVLPKIQRFLWEIAWVELSPKIFFSCCTEFSLSPQICTLCFENPESNDHLFILALLLDNCGKAFPFDQYQLGYLYHYPFTHLSIFH